EDFATKFVHGNRNTSNIVRRKSAVFLAQKLSIQGTFCIRFYFKYALKLKKLKFQKFDSITIITISE
ncbi:MAG: hypothetical protein ACM3JQ_04685, partial [Candidatus Eiseniibacteriota bacterium]